MSWVSLHFTQELAICILCYPSSHRISYKIVYEYKENAKSLVNLGKNIFFTEVYFDKNDFAIQFQI